MDTLSLKNKLCRCKPHGAYALSFALPLLLYLCLLMRLDIAPFGEYTALTPQHGGDLFRSYLSFHAFLNGEGSLFMNPAFGEVTGEIFSILASPLSYLLFFVKAESLFSALFIISAIKCGLAGLFMAMLLCRFSRLPLCFLPTFATLYAMGIPTLSITAGLIYSDLAVFVPLLLYLFARISDKGFGFLFSLSLALALAADARAILFYALLLLFAFCYFPLRRTDLLRAFFFSVAGILLSMVAVIPSLFLYTGEVVTVAPRRFTVPWLSALTSLFSGTFFPTDGGIILLSLGVPVLLLLPLFFANRKLPLFRRCASGAFLLLLATGVVLFPIYKIFSLNFSYGQLPPYGALLLLFFSILFAAMGFPKKSDARLRTTSLFSLGALVLALTLLQKLHRTFLSADELIYPILDDMHGVWLAIFIGIAATACFYILSENGGKKAKHGVAFALSVVAALSTLLYGYGFAKNSLFEKTASPTNEFAEELDLTRTPSLPAADVEDFLANCLGTEKEQNPLSSLYKSTPYLFTTLDGTKLNSPVFPERLNARLEGLADNHEAVATILLPPAYTFPGTENYLTRLKPHSYLKGYHAYYAKREGASLLFSVIGNGDALYLDLSAPALQSLTITANGAPHDYTGGPLYLGTYAVGEEVLVVITPDEFSLVLIPTSGKIFFTLSEESINALSERLASASPSVEVTSGAITTTLCTNKDTTVATFLPYHENLRLEIDGVAAELFRDADGYVTFPLPSGEHTVHLYYHIDGLALGAALLLSGLFLLISYLSVYQILKKRKGAANEHHPL